MLSARLNVCDLATGQFCTWDVFSDFANFVDIFVVLDFDAVMYTYIFAFSV